LRDTVLVVPGSATDEQFARQLVHHIDTLGLRAWSLQTHVDVGRSLIAALNQAIEDAAALVLIRSPAKQQDPWALLQQHAYQASARLSGPQTIIVFRRARAPIPVTLRTQALVLNGDVSPEDAARTCFTILTSTLAVGSYRPERPPDSPGAPLLRPGAWTQVPDFSASFATYIAIIGSLADLKEYEHALDLYWKVLYFSGYRELWGERLAVSSKLLRLARRSHDEKTEGLILARGIAYAYLSQNGHDSAQRLLKRAYRVFEHAKNHRGLGIVWSYLGDVFAAEGREAQALEAFGYGEAELEGLERRQVQLKATFYRLTQDESANGRRVDLLLRLRDQFAAIGDYREGLVDLEIARALDRLGSPLGLDHAQRAVTLFRDTIAMPRNAVRAEAVLAQILVSRRLPRG
jgi:hypothetical protein